MAERSKQAGSKLIGGPAEGTLMIPLGNLGCRELACEVAAGANVWDLIDYIEDSACGDDVPHLVSVNLQAARVNGKILI
jgi:hypothetical protein